MAKTCRNVRKSFRLPALPASVQRLVTASEDRTESLANLAEIASTDPVIAANILRLANSPLFSPGKKIRSLNHAAVIIGIPAIRNLAVSVALCQTLGSMALPRGFELPEFWRHAITAAVIARIIARSIDCPNPEEAFAAALVHDIGLLILAMQDGGEDIWNQRQRETGCHDVVRERRLFGTDHAIEGARTLQAWNLPPTMVSAVGLHHRTPEDLAKAPLLARIVFAADLLAHHFDGTASQEMAELLSNTNRVLTWQPADMAAFVEEVGGELEETADSLGLEIDWQGVSKRPKLELLIQEEEERLGETASNMAALTGTLEAIIGARTLQELLDALFTATGLLTDMESAVVLLGSDHRLTCMAAKGTRDDDAAAALELEIIPDSIWSKAFSLNRAIFSEDFFRTAGRGPMEEHVEQLLGGPFVAAPMTTQGRRVGLMVFGTGESGTHNPQESDQLALMELMARQFACALEGLRYRQRWRKEYAIGQAVLQHSPAGVVLCDSDGEISMANPASLRLIGLSEEEVFGARLQDILRLPPPLEEALFRLRNGEELDLGRIEQVTASENKRWIGLKVSAVDLLGFRRLIFVLQDETAQELLGRERELRRQLVESELKRKSLELEQAQQRLIQAEKSSIAVSMARKVVHEASTPLNTIKNYLKIMRLEIDGGGLDTSTIDAINKEIDRVMGIIRGLTQLSETGCSQKTGSIGCDVASVVQELLSIAAPVARERGVEIGTSIQDGLPQPAIPSDKLKQVLLNMINNSLEAMERDSRAGGRIEIRAFADKEAKVTIEVEDDGPGIAEEHRARVFDPFYTTRAEGSGIGLAVCLGIVQAHGGTITIEETETGRGAKFRIELPASPAGKAR